MSKLIFVLWIVLLPVLTGAMDSRIRKANYLYEFEGEEQEALLLLKSVVKDGSKQDKSASLYYQARIHDSRGRSSQAVLLYRNYLASMPQDAETMRLVSLRLAEIDSTLSKLVRSVTKLPYRPYRRVPGEAPLLQLTDRSLWNLQNGKLVRSGFGLTESQVPLEATRHSLWFWDRERRVVEEKLYSGGAIRSSFSVSDSILSALRMESGEWLIRVPGKMTYYRKGKSIWQRNDFGNGCQTATLLHSSNEAILRCGSDTLRSISLRDGAILQQRIVEDVDTVMGTAQGLWVTHASSVRYYADFRVHDAKWQQNFHSILSVLMHSQRLFIMEENGTLNMLDARTGMLLDKQRVEPGRLFLLGSRLGVLSAQGQLTVLDNRARMLWKYHAGKASGEPMCNDDGLLLPLLDGTLVSLDPMYHGGIRTDLQENMESLERLVSMARWDSVALLSNQILKVEPGNALAWSAIAQSWEARKVQKDSVIIAWGNAARHSRSLEGEKQKMIFQPYAQRIGAKWIQALPFSSQSYPRFFGHGRHIHTIDAGNRRLVALDSATGVLRWKMGLMPLHKGYLMNQDGRYLALTSGKILHMLDLENKGRKVGEANLPAPIHQIMQTPERVFLSTWEGHILSLQKRNLSVVWSVQPFSQASFLMMNGDKLMAVSLTGEKIELDLDSGVTSQQGRLVQGRLDQVQHWDGLHIVALQDGRLVAMGEQGKVWEYNSGAQVYSMQAWRVGGKPVFILGLSDQRLVMLDRRSGQELWSWSGSGSIFIYPSLAGHIAYLDQSNQIVAIDLETGKVVHRIALQERSGPIWSNSSSVLATTAQGLLFSFPIFETRVVD